MANLDELSATDHLELMVQTLRKLVEGVKEPGDFTNAVPGDVCWVYVDTQNLSDHYCVFGLEWFEERDGPITLKRQKWALLSEDELVLPDPLDRLKDDDDAEQ